MLQIDPNKVSRRRTFVFYQPNEERSEEHQQPLWKCLLAEFVGTFLLIFIGCGCVLLLSPVPLPLTGIALCWAFIVQTLGQTIGHISADLNPAITLAFLATRRTTILKTCCYIPVQLAGSTVGAAFLRLLMPPQKDNNYGLTLISPLISPLQGVFLEVIATFILVFTIFGASDTGRRDLKGSAPLSIGFCVAGIILAVGPLTGASLNPARSFGPCLVSLNFKDHWVHWVGPICGGLIGGLLYQYVFKQPDEAHDHDHEHHHGHGDHSKHPSAHVMFAEELKEGPDSAAEENKPKSSAHV